MNMYRHSVMEFKLRVWLTPDHIDQTRFDVWFDGLEDISQGRRPESEWAYEFVNGIDLWDLADLDKSKCYQIYATIRLVGSYDYWGEYDEDFTVLAIDFQEVPESYFIGCEIEGNEI